MEKRHGLGFRGEKGRERRTWFRERRERRTWLRV
jgi:hypothetical protein